MKKKILYSIFIVIMCLTAGYFWGLFSKKQTFSIQNLQNKNKPKLTRQADSQLSQNAVIETSENQAASLKKPEEEEKPVTITKKIKQIVPFIVQAPFGNWKDPNFQNACEEASIIMAMGWINGEKTISPTEAQKRILELIDFENKKLGYSIDTNTTDIAKIFLEYFQHTNVTARENITLDDIKAELQKGNLIIVPAFGRALKNLNFTQPGPIVHMLLIIGYDPLTQEFITNDPGTRKGESYRYTEKVLFEAIWEYPSGPTNPPVPVGQKMKAMVSVAK